MGTQVGKPEPSKDPIATQESTLYNTMTVDTQINALRN